MVQVVWDSRLGRSRSSLASSCGRPRRLKKYEEDSAGVRRRVLVVDGRAISWDEGLEMVHMTELVGLHFLGKSIPLSALQPSRKLSGSGDTKDVLKRTLDSVKECQVPPSVASHCLLTAINHSASDKVPPIVRQVLLNLSTSASPTISAEESCQKMLLARRDSILQRKPIFFICNPFGGKKKAAVIFNELVGPLFHLAGQAFEYRGGASLQH